MGWNHPASATNGRMLKSFVRKRGRMTEFPDLGNGLFSDSPDLFQQIMTDRIVSVVRSVCSQGFFISLRFAAAKAWPIWAKILALPK